MMLTLNNILLASVVMLSASTAATAANIYKEGSIPSVMFDVVSPVVGNLVTPVFILGERPDEFAKSLDSAALRKAFVSTEALSYYTNHLRPESLKYGINGYAIGGGRVPGNEYQNVTCGIVVATDKQMKTTSVMFHEAVHCKSFSELRANPAAWRAAVSMNKPWLGMTNNQYLSMYHEVLAAYMQVAYSANLGVKDGLSMVINAAAPSKNTATSIGYRTARNALRRCSVKDACPTDAVAITEMLKASSSDRADMLLDLRELHAAAVSSGYVVEGK